MPRAQIRETGKPPITRGLSIRSPRPSSQLTRSKPLKRRRRQKRKTLLESKLSIGSLDFLISRILGHVQHLVRVSPHRRRRWPFHLRTHLSLPPLLEIGPITWTYSISFSNLQTTRIQKTIQLKEGLFSAKRRRRMRHGIRSTGSFPSELARKDFEGPERRERSTEIGKRSEGGGKEIGPNQQRWSFIRVFQHRSSSVSSSWWKKSPPPPAKSNAFSYFFLPRKNWVRLPF